MRHRVVVLRGFPRAAAGGVVVEYLVVRQSDEGDRRPGVARALSSAATSALRVSGQMQAVADMDTGDD